LLMRLPYPETRRQDGQESWCLAMLGLPTTIAD
jgi:hypothetical protein